MKQSVELLEPLHAKEASRTDLQCDDVGVVGVGTGISEVLVPLDLPLGSNGDIGLERHSQLHQVDGGGTPDDNVWALVGGGNVLGEVVLTRKVSCNLQPRWQVALAEVEDDCQDIVVPNGVAPQVKGLLAGVENVSKKLVLSTELAPR